MSRIGNKPITIEPGVTVTASEAGYTVVGPKGQLMVNAINGIKVEINGNVIEIKTSNNDGTSNLIGLGRTLISNAIIGVSRGWTKSLELVGVGFRAANQGNDLVLNVGFSHPVTIPAPKGITFTIVENKITVSGVDRYVVGEVAASVKRVKPPEPYKGKGIRYEGEVIRKKLGKAAKAVGGAAGAK